MVASIKYKTLLALCSRFVGNAPCRVWWCARTPLRAGEVTLVRVETLLSKVQFYIVFWYNL